MIKIVIVDDESKVCQLLTSLIDWEKNSMSLQGIASNGRDAVSLILKDKPDIVITDIRMPGIDGLELIRQTRSLQCTTHFIVISGYRQFEYARQALKYGVEDYLLKPISKDDINAVLLKISEEISSSRRQEQNKLATQIELHKSKKTLHAEFIQKMLKRELPVNDSEKILQEYALNFTETSLACVAVRSDYSNPENNIQDQERFLTNRIGEILEEKICGQDVPEFLVDTKNQNLVVGIFNFSDEKSIKEKLDTAFAKIQTYMYAFDSCRVTMGIGKSVSSLNEIQQSIDSALQAVQYRLLLGNNRVIYFNDYVFPSVPTAQQMLESKKTTIRKAVENFDTKTLELVLSSLFNDLLANRNINPQIYYNLATLVTDYFFVCLQVEGTGDFSTQKKNILDQIPLIYTLNMMYRFLTKNLGRILINYREQLKTVQERPVREAEEYIKNHFSDKITLENIASRISKNPVYFSTVFKNKTGQNFSDYLVQTRLEAAKELLRESYEPISLIAEKVGYKDTRYFSQLFTKCVGIKPSVYRKLYS
jgi:two-component system response regulator YesN